VVIRSIGVIGSGTMGGGIAQVAAQSGFDVQLCDIRQDLLDKAIANISGFIYRAAEKGRISKEEALDTLQRIKTTTSLNDLTACDVVIEAAPEDIDLKRDLFGQLDNTVRPNAILATNTSTLSVTQIAAATQNAGRVAGMHFFNPAPLMPLVEVVAGALTDEQTVNIISEVARTMGKTPIRAKDVPGFIVNRVARPFTLEALRLLEEGVADHATIDKLVRQGGGFKMGPFELMDLIGLDINFAASKSVYEASFHEPRYRPSLLQQRMVESGHLGRKTGRGWYDYSEGMK
jgi:3-hydroxybutyryl-CoA dehydrogenase